MTLNDREIIFVTYSTERNWTAELPKSNWLCVLVDNDRTRNYIDEVISKIINNDVRYVCTVGQSCEKTHDLIDEEIVFRQVDIDDHFACGRCCHRSLSFTPTQPSATCKSEQRVLLL